MYLHQKFAFPAACLVFGLLALSLGRLEQQGQQARQLRGRAGGGLRVLHADDDRLVADQGARLPGQPGALAAEHRPRPGGRRAADLPAPPRRRRRPDPACPRWRRYGTRSSGGCRGGAAPARPSRRRQPPPARPRARQAQAPGGGEGAAGEGQPAGESGPGPSRPQERRRSGAAPPSDPARRLRRQGLSPGAAARLRRPARDLLHRLVHRLVRQSLQGPGDDVPAGAVHVVLDAAVRLLRAAAVGPGRHPRHHRAPHQVERADRHARLRRQPVSDGAAAAGPRPAVERPAVRPRGVVPRRLEPQGGGAEAPDARRRAAHVRRPGAPMGGRPRRTDLPLHLLRSAGEDADRPRGLPVPREAVGPGRDDGGPVRRPTRPRTAPGSPTRAGRGASPTTWSPRTRRSRRSR